MAVLLPSAAAGSAGAGYDFDRAVQMHESEMVAVEQERMVKRAREEVDEKKKLADLVARVIAPETLSPEESKRLQKLADDWLEKARNLQRQRSGARS